MRWSEADPRRFKEELEALSERFPRMHLVNRPDGRLGLDGRVRVEEAWRGLRLTWPETYPDQPPEVMEVKAFSEEVVDLGGTGHQLGDGSLCLYTHDGGPESWRPDLRAADALDRYVSFASRATTIPHAEAPTVIGLPLNAVFRISPSVAQISRIPGGRGVAKLRMTHGQASGLIVEMSCHQPSFGPLTWGAAPAWQLCLRRETMEIPWFSVNLGGRPWSSLAENAAELDAWLRQKVPSEATLQVDQITWVLLSREEGEETELLMVQRPSRGGQFGSARLEVADPRDQLFLRVDGAMSGRDTLRQAQVVLVGLGSLGSRIALTLATAGVGRFLLFDPERLGPENVCRHAAGLSHMDQPKVEAVEQLILDRNPDAQVLGVPTGLVWDGPHRTAGAGLAFAQSLEDPETLVVVTVAQHWLEAAINRRCVAAGRPAIYGSVLGPAAHGRVFRVLPGESPCYACILQAQRADPGRYWSLSPEGGTEAPRIAPYDQPGIPGLSLDVDTVALLVARLALQTLARPRPAVSYPDQEGHHLLWTNRGGWGFDHPLQLRVEPYERLVDCPICGSGTNRALGKDELAAIAALERRLRDPARMAPEVPLLAERRTP